VEVLDKKQAHEKRDLRKRQKIKSHGGLSARKPGWKVRVQQDFEREARNAISIHGPGDKDGTAGPVRIRTEGL